MVPTSYFSITCLCGSISEPGTSICDQKAPLNTIMCHCNSCRYTTGSLGATFLRLNSSPSPATLGRLASYKSALAVTRYFCPTCGCSCFFHHTERNEWSCLSGLVEHNTGAFASTKNVVRILSHIYVLDTVDGGLTPFLLQLGNRCIPTWSAAPPDDLVSQPPDLLHATVLSLPKTSLESLSQPGPESYLPAKCHCGEVSLLIKRANHTGETSSRSNHSDPTKYPAYLCACRSCRLSTGTSLVPWTLVNPENVFNEKLVTANGHGPPNVSTRVTFGFATMNPNNTNSGLFLKQYWSSPDTCRSFCHKCGATVSYWCGQRPDELDIAVGILRGKEGSMARRWLGWVWGRCSFPEESLERETCDAWLQSADLMGEVKDRPVK